VKIKKRDLISLIREMAYMGVKKTKKGDSTFFGDNPLTNPDKLEKLFTNKKFKKQADIFFGETKAFPGSNVFIVPMLGDFDWSAGTELRKNRSAVSQFEIFSDTYSRTSFYDLNDQTMKNLLGLTEEETEEIDTSKDVVLLPRQVQIDGDFNSTVHMIFHSFFEGIIELYEDSEETLRNYLPATANVLNLLNSLGKKGMYGEQNINLETGTIGSIRTNATKYLRGKAKFEGIGTGDFYSEILTSSFLRYSGVKNDVIYNDKDSTEYGSVNIEETEKLKMLLRAFANEITNFARGKILEIDVFEGGF